MRNKLTDLNNHLFEQLERLNDEELDDKELDKEIKRAQAMTAVAKAIVSNANVALNAKKHIDKMGSGNEDLPIMLTNGKDE